MERFVISTAEDSRKSERLHFPFFLGASCVPCPECGKRSATQNVAAMKACCYVMFIFHNGMLEQRGGLACTLQALHPCCCVDNSEHEDSIVIYLFFCPHAVNKLSSIIAYSVKATSRSIWWCFFQHTRGPEPSCSSAAQPGGERHQRDDNRIYVDHPGNLINRACVPGTGKQSSISRRLLFGTCVGVMIVYGRPCPRNTVFSAV